MPGGRVLASFAPKPWILAGMCLGLVLFTATAVAALLMQEPGIADDWALFRRIGLWAALVFCPVYAWDVLQRSRRSTPTLVATTGGLAFRSILGFSPVIPWAEIEAIGPIMIGKKVWLAIVLADPARTLGRFGTAMRLMHVRSHAAGEPNIAFRAIQLGTSPAEAAKVLERIRVRNG